MRYLFVVRHCEARPARAGESDLGRPLSERGRTQVLALRQWLSDVAQARGYLPVRLLVSSARRTLETAEAFRGHLEGDAVVSEAIYNGVRDVGANDMLKELESIEGANRHLAVVGHNPTVSDLVFHLLGRWPEELSRGFAPGTAVVLGFDAGAPLGGAHITELDVVTFD